MAPEEIRSIRQSLGLTQVEAGELLGGGPRAFSKYESGTVKPAASLISLLRLLEADPGAIATLGGRAPQPISAFGVRQFEVTGEHISALGERRLPPLLRKLLIAEAQANHLPMDGIHVASNINTPDGGEDGRIEWTGEPDRTSNLPSRICQFQLKAGKMAPGEAASEILTGNGKVKDMVHQVLASHGHYILLCAQPYNQKETESRENRICKALREAEMTVEDTQVHFKDADQIASWVNSHPFVATWVKEQIQPGGAGPFRSWNHWAGRAEHDSSPWVEDERLPKLHGWLYERVQEPRSSVRCVGLSGVGKSRLLLEALGLTEDGTAESTALSDIVLYAIESEMGLESINEAVQALADVGTRAIVVVDDCRIELHQTLSRTVSRAGSRLSLITIDYDIPPAPLDNTTFKVDEAPTFVTQSIINRVPGLSPEDRRRLAQFARGFPGIGIRIAEAWISHLPIAHATEDILIDAFVLGRNPQSDSLLKSAALMATFGLVQAGSPSGSLISNRRLDAAELDEIANLVNGLTADDVHADLQDLLDRDIVQRRGRSVILQPRPVAMNLAARQWRNWSPAKWDEVLAGITGAHLKLLAARQLALLNTTERAQEIVAHVCRPGGLLWGVEGIFKPAHMEVLSSLAEVDTGIVAALIEHSLEEVADLGSIQGDTRRHLVFALEKITFCADTFEQGSLLLLRLAVAENERWGNNATGQFKALFPLLLGNTEADGALRLSVLDCISSTEDRIERKVIVEALIQGTETRHFSRFGNAGAHGSKPSLESWRPATDAEAHDYIEGCVTRLSKFATNGEEAAANARAGLGHQLRSLVFYGFIDVVESVTREVSESVGYWPEALESLWDFIRYDADDISPQVARRVRSLIDRLQPESLESRVRFLVTEMPWDYPGDEQLDYEALEKRQVEAVRGLADELVSKPDVLTSYLPGLSRIQQQTTAGRVPQRRTFDFGEAMAELSDPPLDWLQTIVQAVLDSPENERDFGLLSGYISRVCKDYPECQTELKKFVTGTSQLSPAFPQICMRLGITPADVPIAIEALQSGLLHPRHLQRWRLGGQLAKLPCDVVAPLLDLMLASSGEASSVALELMVMYIHGDQDRLEGLRPQIRRIVKNETLWNLDSQSRHGRNASRNAGDIIKWLLGKGREDEDARSAALELAKGLVSTRELGEQRVFQPLIPALLSGFPEIVWPLIGQAIVSDPLQAFRLTMALRDSSSFESTLCRAVLSLPEETLFAWCHANPDSAPAFAAEILPVLTSYQPETSERLLHPLMARLIDEFGQRDDVWQAIGGNIHTFSWSGSATAYYELFLEPLRSLQSHPKAHVRTRVRRLLRNLDSSIKSAQDRDEELEAQEDL